MASACRDPLLCRVSVGARMQRVTVARIVASGTVRELDDLVVVGKRPIDIALATISLATMASCAYVFGSMRNASWRRPRTFHLATWNRGRRCCRSAVSSPCLLSASCRPLAADRVAFVEIEIARPCNRRRSRMSVSAFHSREAREFRHTGKTSRGRYADALFAPHDGSVQVGERARQNRFSRVEVTRFMRELAISGRHRERAVVAMARSNSSSLVGDTARTRRQRSWPIPKDSCSRRAHDRRLPLRLDITSVAPGAAFFGSRHGGVKSEGSRGSF